MKIEEIDKNFKTASVGDVQVCYFNALEKPFVLEGFPWRKPGGKLYRIPEEFTENEVNAGVLELAYHTAGGAVRFCTDSKVIALRAKLWHSCDMNHMPRAGSAGFDIFCGKAGERYHAGTAQPGRDMEILEVIIDRRESSEMREYLLNMPLYGGAETVEIGLEPGSTLEAPPEHRISRPVLFYGSSITQGGCASRPGNAYSSMLCREVDAPQINLGFSGSGKGEKAMAEAIAGLDLAAFVMDYDHNAPSAEHLEETHEAFFRIIREKNPELPIIIMSKCDIWQYRDYDVMSRRREVIRRTYENAVKSGDKKVWFIDGETLFGSEHRDLSTVDGCHPNDLGFYRMFQTVLPVLKDSLKA